MKLIKLIVSLLIISVLTNCTSSNVAGNGLIQKRKYRKGFFINNSQNIKNNAKSQDEVAAAVNFETETLPNTNLDKEFHEEQNQSVSINDNNPINFDEQQESRSEPIQQPEPTDETIIDDCDVILLKNGKEVIGRVTEINVATIKYVQCDGSGPTYTITKNTVRSITYADGRIDEFNKVEKQINKTSDDIEYVLSEDEGKNQLVALLLCFFIGALGIHRFYLGYTGMGILYIFTFGLCGIGILVDFILIITGSLKPKNGEYGRKL